MKSLFRLLTLFSLLLVFSAPTQAASRCPKRKTYKVKSGESLWSISQKLFGNPRKYRRIYRCNNFPGKPPYLLTPGSVIYVPGDSPRHDAHVRWYKRTVKTKSPKSIDWKRLRGKQKPLLWRMYKVSTGRKSFAGIQFEDRSQSRLRMREESLLLIYGDSLLKSKVTKRFKTRVRLEKGVIRGGLGSMFKQAGLDISTPSGKIKLRSKKSQIEVDTKKTSIVSVYQGNAKVSASGRSVNVLDGYGTFVKKGKPPAKPVRLPARMQWKAPVVVVLVPRGQKGNVEARWKKNSRAARYRVELSHSPTFNRFFYDNARVSGSLGGFLVRDLAPGTYYARVSAIDKNKLEGRPSRPLKIEVVGLETSRVLSYNRGIRIFEVVGLLEMKAPGDKGRLLEYSLDNGPFTSFESPLRLSKPGLYGIRFRSKGSSKIASQFKLRLLRIKASMTPVTSAQKRPGPPVKVQFKVFVKSGDGKTKRAFPQGLRLTAYPGGTQKIRYNSTTQSFEASIPLPMQRSLKEMVVRLAWFGGDLAEGRIPLEPPPLPKYKVTLNAETPLKRKPGTATLRFSIRDDKGKNVRPKELTLQTQGQAQGLRYDSGTQLYSAVIKVPGDARVNSVPVVLSWQGGELLRRNLPVAAPLTKPFGWPNSRISNEWGPLSAVPPSQTADIRTILGLSSMIFGNNPRESKDNLYLRLALRGSLSLLGDRLGLDAELPWFQMNLQQDSATLTKLGDPRLGVRYAFVKGDKLTMGAGLRFTLPVGDVLVGQNNQKQRQMPIEASFLLRFSPMKWLHLSTHQTILGTADFSNGFSLSYSTALGATVRPVKWFSAGFELHLFVPFVGNLTQLASSPLGLAVSGALRFHFDRFQVSLVGGGGLTEAARRQFGSFSAGLNLDLRF